MGRARATLRSVDLSNELLLEYLTGLGVPGLATALLWLALRAVARFVATEVYPAWQERERLRLEAEVDLAVSLALLTERLESCSTLMLDVRSTLERLGQERLEQ